MSILILSFQVTMQQFHQVSQMLRRSEETYKQTGAGSPSSQIIGLSRFNVLAQCGVAADNWNCWISSSVPHSYSGMLL
jgi:hypothetical protein